MRIYTEVIFEWDDKQNQLVETSSESFDYNGDLALCGADWVDTYYYSLDGIRYHHRYKKTDNILGVRADKSTMYRIEEDGSETKIGSKQKEQTGTTEHIDWAVNFVKSASREASNGEISEAYTSAADAQNAYTSHLENYFGGEEIYKRTGLIKQDGKYVTPGDDWTSPWDVATSPDNPHEDFTQDWYDFAIEAGDIKEEDWKYDPETDKYVEFGKFGEGTEELGIFEGSIKGLALDWERIVDPEQADMFQNEIDTARKLLELDAGAVTKAYEDIEEEAKTIQETYLTTTGRAETDYTTGEERATTDYITDIGILDDELDRLEADYLEDVERIIGEDVIDPDTGEILEPGGTYTVEMREALDDYDDAIEDIADTRESAYETLREEAGVDIRAAEAKVGAAGFAASGVGKTARETLAEEIGEEAEGIDVAFSESKERATEGYNTRTLAAGTTKTTQLADFLSNWDFAKDKISTAKDTLLTTKTTALEDLLTLKDTVVDDAETARKLAGGKLTDPWEEASNLFNRQFIGYESAVSTQTTEAENYLRDLQIDMEGVISGAREFLELQDDPHLKLMKETWSPFRVEGILEPYREEFGWFGHGKSATFDPSVPYGIYGAVPGDQEGADPYGFMGQKYYGQYTPFGEKPELYAGEEYIPPWIEDPDWLVEEEEGE